MDLAPTSCISRVHQTRTHTPTLPLTRAHPPTRTRVPLAAECVSYTCTHAHSLACSTAVVALGSTFYLLWIFQSTARADTRSLHKSMGAKHSTRAAGQHPSEQPASSSTVRASSVVQVTHTRSWLVISSGWPVADTMTRRMLANATLWPMHHNDRTTTNMLCAFSHA